MTSFRLTTLLFNKERLCKCRYVFIHAQNILPIHFPANSPSLCSPFPPTTGRTDVQDPTSLPNLVPPPPPPLLAKKNQDLYLHPHHHIQTKTLSLPGCSPLSPLAMTVPNLKILHLHIHTQTQRQGSLESG
jgi:hypothetical protein